MLRNDLNVERRVENYILDELKKYGSLCFPLIDSENSINAALIGNKAQNLGASAILIGGSSATDQIELAEVVFTIKSKINIPVILFPGNVTGVVPKADAILFSSLLNSENPYFITGAQALGALSVKNITSRHYRLDILSSVNIQRHGLLVKLGLSLLIREE